MCFKSSEAQPWINYNTINSSLPENSVRVIKFGKDSSVWIGTDFGLAKLKNTSWTVYHIFNTGGGLPDESIRAITIDSDNVKWIGTVLGGLTKFNDTTWASINTGNSQLPDDYVKDVEFDQSGNTWIATTNGLVRIDTSQSYTIYNTLNSTFASDNIAKIFIDPDNNNKIIGTVNGGLNILTDTTLTIYTIANGSGIPDNSLVDIEKDNSGNYWMASPSNGLIAKVAGGGWVTFNVATGFPTSGLTSLELDSNDNMWIGSIDSGIIRKSGLQINAWNINNSPLTDNYVQCIALAPDGKLWIGTQSSGVFVMDISIITSTIESNEKNNLNLFPNPVHNFMFVNASENDYYKFRLTDISGVAHQIDLKKISTDQYLINMSRLTHGIYILVAENNKGEIIIKKIIKQ